MKGLLTIVEGVGKGTSKPLQSALTIVGRSSKADFQIDDPGVSRIHLEIRDEAGVFFVENKSAKGALLNGKTLAGVVSLNSGDLIEMGTSKVRFDDAESRPPSMPAPSGAEPVDDLTRMASLDDDALMGGDEKGAPDETRAVAAEVTVILSPDKLPGWKKPKEPEVGVAAKKPPLTAVLVAVILLALGAGARFYWMKRAERQASSTAFINYHDALFSFSLNYPLDWGKITDDSGMVEYGVGKEGGNQWARLTILTSKDVEHSLTGLTYGFNKYQAVLKQRHAGFAMDSSRIINVNNAKAVAYRFATSTGQGKGMYLLNGDARIVVECVSAKACVQQYDSLFKTILDSFQFGGLEPQLFIQFPLPDDGMRQLALANKAELAREVEAHTLAGQMLVANRGLKPDNLFVALREFRQALQLSVAGPEPLPAYRVAAKDLSEATRLFNQQLNQQKFEISRALRESDGNGAYWAANKLMQMIPDKTDDDYREAYRIVLRLQPK